LSDLNWEYTLQEFTYLNPTIVFLRLKPAHPQQALIYQAGQYTEALYPDGTYQPFSIANIPNSANTLELHVRVRPSDYLTQDFLQKIQQTQQIFLKKAQGHCIYRRSDSSGPRILIAGGTGFAHIKPLLETALENHEKQALYFYWSVNSLVDVYFPNLLHQWAKRLENFHYTIFMRDKNLLTSGVQHQVVQNHPDLSAFQTYISGPPGLVFAAYELFQQYGLHKNFIYSDMLSYSIPYETN
jgi:CDP-4-dehydro-6-deoxyglucose reductase